MAKSTGKNGLVIYQSDLYGRLFQTALADGPSICTGNRICASLPYHYCLPLLYRTDGRCSHQLERLHEASPEGFDVVQYNSLTTTNASADVLMNRLVNFDAASGKLVPSLADSWEVSPMV